MKTDKLALFDFCETLVSIQSADRYIDFVRNNINSNRMKVLELIRIVLVKFRFFSIIGKIFRNNIWHKKLKLYQLKGISKDKLLKLAKDYYTKELKPKLTPIIIEELKKRKEQGYRIIIVSGGYSIYIKYFGEEFGVNKEDIIATDIDFENGKCKGNIKGLDCMKANKIIRIKEVVDINKYNLKGSYAYSDSKTDLPLLKFVGNGIVTYHKEQKWANKNNLKQMIYEKNN